MTDDLKLRQWDRCWPGNINLEVAVDEALARITDLEARLAAAEAGEDALAEALRSYRADLCEGFCLEAEWSDEAHNHPEIQRDCGGCLAAAALAAYGARRKG